MSSGRLRVLLAVMSLAFAACQGGASSSPAGSLRLAPSVDSSPGPTAGLLEQYNTCLIEPMPTGSLLDAFERGEPNTAHRYDYCGQRYPAVAKPQQEVDYLRYQECLQRAFLDEKLIADCRKAWPQFAGGQ